MMKSLRSSGSFTAARICLRYSSDPWKNFSSVSTDRQLAPAASYSRAIRTGSKSGRITPAEGEAFFTSAINATGPALGFRSAPAKSRQSPRARSAAFKSATDNRALRQPRHLALLLFNNGVEDGHRLTESWLGRCAIRASDSDFGFGLHSSSSLTPCIRLMGQPARSQAFTNWSRSPSITACTLLVSTPVRRSFTIRYGWKT